MDRDTLIANFVRDWGYEDATKDEAFREGIEELFEAIETLNLKPEFDSGGFKKENLRAIDLD